MKERNVVINLAEYRKTSDRTQGGTETDCRFLDRARNTSAMTESEKLELFQDLSDCLSLALERRFRGVVETTGSPEAVDLGGTKPVLVGAIGRHSKY